MENGILCVDVELQVRLVYLRGGRITSAYQKDTFSLSHNDRVMTLDSGIHVIKCPKCDANIDVTKGVCEYWGPRSTACRNGSENYKMLMGSTFLHYKMLMEIYRGRKNENMVR